MATDSPTDERVSPLPDRYRGHTPGKWRYARWDAQPHYLVEVNLPCINGVAAWFALAHVFIPNEAEVGYTDGAHSEEAAEANAALIADAPTLLAEVKRLRGSLAEVMGWINNWDPEFVQDDDWPAAAERARTALEGETK